MKKLNSQSFNLHKNLKYGLIKVFCIVMLTAFASTSAYSADYVRLASIIHVDNYADKCMNELKTAGFYTSEMTYLGSKSVIIDNFMLVGITIVSEGQGGDKYSVLSCKIEQDQSVVVSGPVRIAKNQAHFTR